MKILKCLSIRQPWAWLIAQDLKDCENRTWSTEHRGPLLIHAAKTPDKRARQYIEDRFGIECPPFEDLARGAIIGCAELVKCTRVESSEWHMHGQWGWYLRNAVAFEEPVLWRGELGLFDVPADEVPEAGKVARVC